VADGPGHGVSQVIGHLDQHGPVVAVRFKPSRVHPAVDRAFGAPKGLRCASNREPCHVDSLPSGRRVFAGCQSSNIGIRGLNACTYRRNGRASSADKGAGADPQTRQITGSTGAAGPVRGHQAGGNRRPCPLNTWPFLALPGHDRRVSIGRIVGNIMMVDHEAAAGPGMINVRITTLTGHGRRTGIGVRGRTACTEGRGVAILRAEGGASA